MRGCVPIKPSLGRYAGNALQLEITERLILGCLIGISSPPARHPKCSIEEICPKLAGCRNKAANSGRKSEHAASPGWIEKQAEAEENRLHATTIAHFEC
jgi:hypothetical protein